MASNTEIETITKTIEGVIRTSLSDLPKPLKAFIEPVIQHNLQILAKKNRKPVIAIYGRSGSGKSSLINAIMGERVAKVGPARAETMLPEVYEYQRDGWFLKFVDSRGVGDTADDSAIQEAADFIVQQKVDIVLFVIPANERSWVYNDINVLTKLKEAHKDKYKRELSVILVINKIDVVEPVEEWNPPYNLEAGIIDIQPKTSRQAKEKNIAECINARTDEYKTLTPLYIPVCSSWHDFGDRRYKIEDLALLMYDYLPDDAKPGFAGATAVASVKKTVARTFTWTSALVAGATCFIPIPLVDLAAMVTIQLTLIGLIARIGSGNKDKKRVAEQFVKNMGAYGAKVTLSALASQLKFIPVVGVPMSIPAAASVAAMTVALGEAASSHFIEGVSIEEAKLVFDKKNKQMREKFKSTFKKRDKPEELVSDLEQVEALLGSD